MSTLKIFNDPIYGLVNFPFTFLYDLIDHPLFQRLRRIQQLGLSSLVYPGATHSRFHHALGALHLADRLILNLRLKGVEITDKEYEATLIAILLHDIGHGPYSHALEYELIPVAHEAITLKIMDQLNTEFHGRLDLAIDIFKGNYEKQFLHQAISGQVDVDRMDYLNRDSYYTGVAEGIIGYDRIIKMLNVADNQLVVEEKGLQSIEKFLLSRHFMYQQVYLHKTALCADHMLKSFFKELKEDAAAQALLSSRPLKELLASLGKSADNVLSLFTSLDDNDIILALKDCLTSKNILLKRFSEGILNRRLFKVVTERESFSDTYVASIYAEVQRFTGYPMDIVDKIVNLGIERSAVYNEKNEIKILLKNQEDVVTFSQQSRLNLYDSNIEVHFITFPKEDS